MAQQDAIIAKGLNAGLRRLIVRALVHSAGEERDEARMDALMDVLMAEIGRLACRAEAKGGEDTELTGAVRNALTILLNAARSDAQSDLSRGAVSLQ